MKPFRTEAIFEDSGLYLAGRAEDALTGDALLQSDLTSITLKVYEISDPDTEIASETLTIANVIFDTLQTDGWTIDSTGYNFRYQVPATSLPLGGAMYRFEFAFVRNPSTLPPFHAVFEVPTLGLYSS